MNDEFLIKQLKSLSRVTPDPVFLKWSRYALLAETTRRARPFTGISFMRAFHARLGFSLASLAFAATAVFAFFIISASPTNPDAIASLNPAAIRREQKAAATNNSATETTYFKGVAPNIALALNDISDQSANWGSANHIKQGISLLHETNN